MNQLKTLRKKAGLTQIELSNQSGVALSTIHQYERGARTLEAAQAGTVYRLANVLGVTMEEIIQQKNKR